jgi:hypothetical protein
MAPPPRLNFGLEDLSIQISINSATLNINVERSADGSGSGKVQISGFIADPGEFSQLVTFLLQQGQI